VLQRRRPSVSGWGLFLTATASRASISIIVLDGRGRLTPWAAELLAGCPDTYVETSPSGQGLHVWGFGTVVKGRKSGNVEVYGTSRYLTVTARRWRHCSTTFADLDEWIGSLPL
jgi:hypothetical protein